MVKANNYFTERNNVHVFEMTNSYVVLTYIDGIPKRDSTFLFGKNKEFAFLQAEYRKCFLKHRLECMSPNYC